MFKIIQQHLELSYVKISAIYAILFMLLFNSAIVVHKLDYYKSWDITVFSRLGTEFLYIYMMLFICFFGLTINRALFYFGVIFLFTTGALASYYLYFFDIIPDKKIIESVFNTNFNVIYRLISARLIIWVIFSIFIAIYPIMHFGINNTKLFVHKIVSALFLLLSINFIIIPSDKTFATYFPMRYLNATYLYFLEIPWRHDNRNHR